MNFQNDWYCYTENPILIHEVPLYQVMVGVWCAMSATKIIGLIVSENKNSQYCVTENLVPFFNIFPITKNQLLFSARQCNTAHKKRN